MENPHDYHKSDGPMTALGAQTSDFSAMPTGLGSVCEIIQGVLIHSDMANFAYDVKLSVEQQDNKHIRPLPEMLARIREIDRRPLTIAREPARRLPCICRHFSMMLSAILRSQSIPARSRCGFGAYFTTGKFEDHWVCEYWNSAASGDGSWSMGNSTPRGAQAFQN